MCGRLIESVAVGVGLGLVHHVAELRGAERASLPACEHLGLEREPRSDVDHDLIGTLQIDVEQCEALGIVVGSVEAGEAGLHDEGLAEDRRRLGERHREPALE